MKYVNEKCELREICEKCEKSLISVRKSDVQKVKCVWSDVS